MDQLAPSSPKDKTLMLFSAIALRLLPWVLSEREVRKQENSLAHQRRKEKLQ